MTPKQRTYPRGRRRFSVSIPNKDVAFWRENQGELVRLVARLHRWARRKGGKG